ncbi:hypothetical protein GCM10027341_43590 [Spirosoma knui]
MGTLVKVTTVVLLIASLLGCTTKETSNEPQFVVNSDIEKTPGQEWVFNYHNGDNRNPNGYLFEHSTEAATSGTHSLKLSCKTIRDSSASCFVYQSFASTQIPASSTITLKAKIRTVNLKGRGVSITLRGDKIVNGKGNPVFYTSTDGVVTINGTTDFKEYFASRDGYGGNTDYLAVILAYLPGTTGTVYFDDVTVTYEVPKPVQ